MSRAQRTLELVTALGTDYKTIKTWFFGSTSGSLANLTTTDKTSVVHAINEVKAAAVSPPDASTTTKGVVELGTLAEHATGTSETLAATLAGVRQERTELKAEILGGVGPAFDTLSELLAEAQEDQPTLAALVTTVGTKANSADVYTKTEEGDPETDLVAAYNAAKA